MFKKTVALLLILLACFLVWPQPGRCLSPQVKTDNPQKFPYLTTLVPVMQSVAELERFIEQHPAYHFCIYVASKTDEQWFVSTSRRYMNQVLGGFIYVPINIEAGDRASLERLYALTEHNPQIVAINHTHPHKGNPVLMERIGTGGDLKNVDVLVKDVAGIMRPFNLNGPSFGSWYREMVGTLKGRKVVIIGVGERGEAIVREIIKDDLSALYLVDVVSKEALAKELGETTKYLQNLSGLSVDNLDPHNTTIIFAVGKEIEDVDGAMQFLATFSVPGNIFVDIRPQVQLPSVVTVNGMGGWTAYTGQGMNARNDYTLLRAIAKSIRVLSPGFESFDKIVKRNSEIPVTAFKIENAI